MPQLYFTSWLYNELYWGHLSYVSCEVIQKEFLELILVYK